MSQEQEKAMFSKHRHLLFMTVCMAAVPHGAIAQDAKKIYTECTSLVRSDANAALQKAESWQRSTGSVAAQHCKALALFELRNYDAAARELDYILQTVTPKQGKLWLSMKRQAAKAHGFANTPGNAERHLSDALHWLTEQSNMEADTIAVLKERGKLYALHNQELKAINDLDHAYSLSPTNDVLLERAEIFMKIGKNESAADDLRLVLANDPNDRNARALLAQIQ